MNFITIPVGSFAANCYVYPLQSAGGDPAADDSGTLCAVIDPGADAKRIIAEIAARRWTPSLFLLTHGHFDHVAALGELYRHYRGYYCNTSKKNGTGQERGETAEAPPTLPIVAIHSGDAQYIGACAADAHRQSIARAIGSASLDLERALSGLFGAPLPEASLILEDNAQIGPFTVLHLPGHTPGSVAFFDKQAKRIFTGDTLFRNGYGRTDLPGGNKPLLVQSLKRLMTLDGDTRVYPGHGDATTISAGAALALRLVASY